MSPSPSLATLLPYQTHEEQQYEAAISTLSECSIPKATWWGKLSGRDLQDIQDDVLSCLPRNRRKNSDDEIIALIKKTYGSPRPPEPLPMDDPLPDSPSHQQKSVVEPVPQAIEADTSNKKGVIESLNETHAVVMLAGKCVILNRVVDPTTGRPDINFSTIQDFKARYQNRKIPIEIRGRTDEISIAELWLDSLGRKEYAGIVFDPSENTPPGFFNLWQGFAVKPIKGQWKRMERHLLEVICSGDREVFNYLLAWMARLVQDPGGKRPGVVIVLRGKQGTGKGIFVVNFGKIFGAHFRQIISYHLVAGRFNSHFKDALLVFVDEGFWGGDKQAEGILKGMVTEEFIMVEPKGKEAFTIQNHASFIFASNNVWVVPASTEERRFFTIDVSEAKMGNAAYFKELNQEMENGGREAMFYDLLHYDLTGIDLRKFPRREALLDQIIQTWPSEKQFWFELLRAGSIGSDTFSSQWPESMECKRLYDLYSAFAANIGDRFKATDRSFGKMLKEICPSIQRRQKRQGEKIEWHYFLPPLFVCREKLENLLRIPINWDEGQ